MKLIITIGLIIISTLSFAQKKHWINENGSKTKKKIATKYYTVAKNKPNKNYIVNIYNKETNNLIESTSYRSKKTVIKEGEYVSYYENKNIMVKGTYLDNLKDGTWTTYTDNSKLQSIINYSKDKKNGPCEVHSINDYSKGFYSLNKKIKEWTFYNMDGILTQKTNYKNDLLDGELTTYHSNGNIYMVMLYKEGKLKDVLKELDANGNKIEMEQDEVAYDWDLKETTDDNTIYNIVDDQPEFPGGSAAMLRFLSENTIYPKVALEKKISGRIYIKFTVEKDGSISNVRDGVPPGRGVHDILLKEAIRVVKSMPKWKPGKQRGKTVRVSYTVPVNFKI